MKLKPARGYILIEPIQDTEKTSVGVYLPEQAKDKPMRGKVIGVGLPKNHFYDVKFEPEGGATLADEHSPVEKGDIAYYKKWGNEEVKEDGKEYVFVKFEDILGVYEPD